MKISGISNLNMGVQNSPFAKNVNRSLDKNASGDPSLIRSDSVRFGQAAKQNQKKVSPVLESLMKQKDNLMEQRKSIAEGLKGSEDTNGLASQLKEINKQIEEIDEQIKQEMLLQGQKEGQTEEKKKSSDEPKTKEEVQAKQLNAVTIAAQGVQSAKTIQSVQSKVDAEKRVLSSQAETDGADTLASTHKRIAELDAKSNSLINQVGKTLSSATKNIQNEVQELTEASRKEDTKEVNLSEKTEPAQSQTVQEEVQKKEEEQESAYHPLDVRA